MVPIADDPAGGPPAISAETAEFLSGGVAIMVATRGADLLPEITRGWGPAIADDGLAVRLSLIAPPESRTRANLEANGSIAVNCTLPSSYRSVQVKGSATELLEPDEASLARAREHAAAFAEDTGRVGAPAPSHLYVQAIDLVVSFSVEELYDQTPGPAAGSRL
jgi:hypothetical protein